MSSGESCVQKKSESLFVSGVQCSGRGLPDQTFDQTDLATQYSSVEADTFTLSNQGLWIRFFSPVWSILNGCSLAQLQPRACRSARLHTSPGTIVSLHTHAQRPLQIAKQRQYGELT